MATWSEQPIIYDGVDPEDYPDDGQDDWWVDAVSVLLGVAVGVAVLAGLWWLAAWSMR